MSPRRPLAHLLPVLSLAACWNGSNPSAPVAIDVAPELLACRARVDDPHAFAEIALRDTRNLGVRRVADRTGVELRARLHPDGSRVVFARQRTDGDPQSRELFVGTIDNSQAEVRLTQNADRDDAPSWSPDGSHVLFTSDRDGPAELWTMAADGSGATRLFAAPNGFADDEADWHRDSDRIVWSRRDPNGHHTLWLASSSGAGMMPLTDGGAAVGDGSGDHDPAISPDGTSVVFVRRSATGRASLCLCDLATAAVTVRLAPDGDVGFPRFTPAMDRLFFGLAEPGAGRAGLRLAYVPLAAGEPTLLWPDERWEVRGLDFVAGVPALGTLGQPHLLDIERANVQIAVAAGSFGAKSQLAAADGNEFYLLSRLSAGRQLAAINCRFDLPAQNATDVLEVHARAVARSTRVGGDSLMRLWIYNPVEQRFDVAVEATPTSTAAQTLSFRTSSLRHVTKNKQLRVGVGIDLPDGDPAGFWIDLVEVQLIARPQL